MRRTNSIGKSGAGDTFESKTTRELQRPTEPSGIYANWDPEVRDFGTSRQYPVLKQTPGGIARQR